VRLGTVDEDDVFILNHRYMYAEEAFYSCLVFPLGWDLSKAKAMNSQEPRRSAFTDEDRSRLYGDVWLLEQDALQTGLRGDLEVPKGCALSYVSRKTGPKKRGRPKKPVVESQ